jgi:hypothetical protein
MGEVGISGVLGGRGPRGPTLGAFTQTHIYLHPLANLKPLMLVLSLLKGRLFLKRDIIADIYTVLHYCKQCKEGTNFKETNFAELSTVTQYFSAASPRPTGSFDSEPFQLKGSILIPRVLHCPEGCRSLSPWGVAGLDWGGSPLLPAP